MHAATGTTTQIFHNLVMLRIYICVDTNPHDSSVRPAAKKDSSFFFEGLDGVVWLGWLGIWCRLGYGVLVCVGWMQLIYYCLEISVN